MKLCGAYFYISLVVTAAFAVLNYFKEKKENAELEAYLEGSIQ